MSSLQRPQLPKRSNGIEPWPSPCLFSLQAPLLPRLGLLALACSDGKVLLFSLPHPEALLALQPAGEQHGSEGTAEQGLLSPEHSTHSAIPLFQLPCFVLETLAAP